MEGQTGEIVTEKQPNDESVKQPPQAPQIPTLAEIPSQKKMREMMMPKVGDKFGECKVIYVNAGQFRFTAEGVNLPDVGAMFESDDGRMYQVERAENGRFNGVFKGFKQNPVAPPPVDVDDNLVKII